MNDSFHCKTSVKDWVEFCCRSGDLVFESSESGPQGRITAVQGQRAHRRIQQLRHAEHGEAFAAEVSVKGKHRCEFSPGMFGTLQFQGRIDGVIKAANKHVIVEEIKTVPAPDAYPHANQTALHLAQAKVYAFGYLKHYELPQAEVRVCYTAYEKNTDTRLISEELTLAELEQFVDTIARQFLSWQWRQQQHMTQRNAALTALPFPFSDFRAQQRELSESVYKAIALKRPLLSEAPTGSGKTLAHLFPALKAIGTGKVEKIIFVTAKISGQHTALDTLRLLQKNLINDKQHAELRCIQIPAKDRSCFCRTASIDSDVCAFTQGYFDRMPAARDDVLECGFVDKDKLLHIAQKHQVCPFQLVQDCLSWSDVIVADYNYVFDPLVSFNHFLEQHAKHSTLLVDEAHNLAERARDMFSARLSYLDTLDLAAKTKSLDKALHKSVQQLAKVIKDLAGSAQESSETIKDQPDDLLASKVQATLDQFVSGLLTGHSALQEHFRSLIRYQVISDLFAARHKNILRSEPVSIAQNKKNKSDYTITLFNTDPAEYTGKTLSGFHSSCLFSASLIPMEYHRESLGLAADIATQSLASPFAADHLKLIVNTAIDTRYKQRDNSYQAIAELLPSIVNPKPGNYIVAFPSYHYLNRVLERVTPLSLVNFDIVTQEDFDTPEKRQEFLQELREQKRAKLLFAVTGGSFTEAVDLPGEQLLGIIVIGVGLPQIGIERELIKQRFEVSHQGFEFAYQYPGWTRILQSVGRVIRSESDHGIAVLIDSRYTQSRYRRLFPSHWQARYLNSKHDIAAAIESFWQSAGINDA